MKPLSITAKRMLRRAVAAFCACACVFAVSACGADETGKIRIGIKFDQPGLGFKKNGTYVGFDVDVAKYVAKKLGYSEDEIVWKESPSKQREAMLQNGDVDYIVASYSITDERKKVVDFAGPYFVAGQDLLVRKDETGIDGPKDLNGKRLCSMTGTTSAVNVKEKFAKQPRAAHDASRRAVLPRGGHLCDRHAGLFLVRHAGAGSRAQGAPAGDVSGVCPVCGRLPLCRLQPHEGKGLRRAAGAARGEIPQEPPRELCAAV